MTEIKGICAATDKRERERKSESWNGMKSDERERERERVKHDDDDDGVTPCVVADSRRLRPLRREVTSLFFLCFSLPRDLSSSHAWPPTHCRVHL